MVFSSTSYSVNRRTPLPRFIQGFTAGPAGPTPRSPTVSTSFSPPITSNNSRPTSPRSPHSSQSTKSQRRRSPPSLYFPADFCGPPKKPKPMPKLPRKGSALADAPSFPQFSQPPEPPFINVSHPEHPLLHITHSRSQSNFSSSMSDSTENEIRELHPQLATPSDSFITQRRPPTPESGDEASSMLGLFSVAQLRRRKMEKITRTLGEAVPAELVFPNLSKAEVLMEFRPLPVAGKAKDKEKEREKASKAGRRSSISVSTLSSFASLSSLTNFTTARRPSTPSGPTLGLDDPLAIKTSQRKRSKKAGNVSQRSSMSSFTAPSPLVFANSSESSRPGPPAGHRSAANTSVDRQDQASRWTQTADSFKVQSEENLRDYFATHIRSSSPFYDAVVPLAKPHRLPSSDDYEQSEASDEEGVGRSVTRTRTEKTQGWMGEWNRDDMDHVMKKLRALK